jgi:hypothetical protein
VIARNPIAVPGEEATVRDKQAPALDILPDEEELVAMYQALHFKLREPSCGRCPVFVIDDGIRGEKDLPTGFPGLE